MLHGTDISAYQDTTVPGGDFVIIKATEGSSYVNSKLAGQVADAHRKNMLIGFYHFPDFGNDPATDAAFFADTIATHFRTGDVVVLDHEAASPPDATHCAQWGRRFLTVVEGRVHRRPWVYSNVSWAEGGYCDGMGAYPYWCADPSSPAGQPTIRGPFKSWVAHQYDIANLDLDVFNGTRADWLGAPTPTPTPEDEMLARDLKTGLDQKTGFPFPAGKFSAISLFADNTYSGGAVKATAPVKVRVVVHHTDGSWQITEASVGQAPTDKKPSVAVVHFDNPSASDAVDITRESGDGTEPISFCVY